MSSVSVKRGYDLRLAGKPTPTIIDAGEPRQIGINPAEFGLVKLRTLVSQGDTVKAGAPLLEDRAHPEIKFTSPVAGQVAEVKRGARRVLLQITIDVDPAQGGVEFGSINLASASREVIRDVLLASGLFVRIKQHPFGRIPNPADVPKGIFVSGLATAPLAADPNVVVKGAGDALQAGFTALSKLTNGKVHLGVTPNSNELAAEFKNLAGVEVHPIHGKHPAGDPVVQAFYIDRVKPREVIWHLDIQDVIAIGRLCQTGKLNGERIVALAGDGVKPDQRRYYRTRAGVLAGQITTGRLQPGEQRIISGDVLTGTKIAEDQPLGMTDSLLTVIPEGRRRQWFGWMLPGFDKQSYSRAFLSALTPSSKEWNVDTNLHGGHRACIQCGYCNDVCPTDVYALPTWKAVTYGDLEEAEKFGITDCSSCGLCTYVCPSKIEIDSILRDGLVQIQKEG